MFKIAKFCNLFQCLLLLKRDFMTSFSRKIYINHGLFLYCRSVDGYVRNYDLRKGQLKEDCMGEPMTCVSFTEDEQCVLASCLDSTIKLIDKETGCVLNTYKSHTNKDFKIENSVAIKDTSIISGSEDGTLFIWDLITAEVTFERKKAHNSVLYGLSRHPSKNIFVTASTDSVKLWKDNGEKDDEE